MAEQQRKSTPETIRKDIDLALSNLDKGLLVSEIQFRRLVLTALDRIMFHQEIT